MGDNDGVSGIPDDERPVDLSDDEPDILPDQTRDDTGTGWGDRHEPDDDARLLDERPPHW